MAVDPPAYSAEAVTRPVRFGDMIREVIVTARKREEGLKSVPVSVTALGGDDVRAFGLSRLDSLDAVVPNLLLTNSIGTGNSGRVSLRGIGQGESSSSADPAVGIYVDGVYMARFQTALLSPLDVERIEVLRGPQGTLFGKNTVGGAINIVSARPEFEFGGDAELRIGNYDRLESRFSLNVPLVPERLSTRLSLATATRDGYSRNRLTGEDFSDDKMLSGRLQVLALPTENLEVQFSVDHAIENRRPEGSKCVFLTRQPNLSGQIATLSGFEDACRRDSQSSDFEFSSDVTYARDDLQSTGFGARVSWDISPNLMLRSISSLRRLQTRLRTDADGTPIPLLQDGADTGRDTQSQWSQELQLAGTVLEGQLRFVAGVYAFGEDARERDSLGPGLFLASPLGLPINTAQPGPATVAGIGRLPLLERRLKVNNRSLAAYGQINYALSERMELTVGLRRTQERKRVDRRTRFVSCPTTPLQPQVMNVVAPCPQALVDLGVSPSPLQGFERSSRFGDWSPMATLSYAASPDLLLYASYGTAFRSGGFNGFATRAVDTVEIDPEDLTSYEVGAKGSFWDGRVRVNASYFYNLVEDLRIPFTSVDPNTGSVAVSQAQADRVLMRGGEVEAQVRLLRNLQVGASIGVLRGEYKSFDPPSPSFSEDERLPDAPNYTMNFTADYQRSLARFGTMDVRLAWQHRGSNLSDFQGTDRLEVSKVGLLSGRIAWTLADGRTQLAAFGSNLLNREYFRNGVSLEDSFGYALRYPAPPRLYGLEVRRSF